ncbi:MAG: DUF1573 domain-containing protein [Candidatus Hydrogenedentes bacterium]|nr:DUF1573 domain-containing protein [Candidatus Hydrogenedentota bacterium]
MDAQSLGEQDSHEKLCGPRSLMVALSRIGYPVDLRQIASLMTISDKGNSFAELKSRAEQFGANAELRETTWQELVRFKGTAVLWVNGNHFVACDPREVSDVIPSKVYVYDPEDTARLLAQDELSRMWNGEALLLKRPAIEYSRIGPRLSWETASVDFGVVKPSKSLEVAFNASNLGNECLTLELGKVGCSCTSAGIDSKVVKPGETTQLRAVLDLSNDRGDFFTSIYVTSNDLDCPSSYLRISGHVSNPQITNPTEINFGPMSIGQTISRHLAVFAPADESFQIIDVRTVGTKNSEVPVEAVTIKVRFGRNEPTRTGLPMATKRDWVIDLTATVESESVEGHLDAILEVMTSKNAGEQPIRVGINGEIVRDIQANPAVLLLGSSKLVAETSIRRRSGGEVEVTSIESFGLEGLYIEEILAGDSKAKKYKVTYKPTVPLSERGSGGLLFKTDDERSVPVKVLYHP